MGIGRVLSATATAAAVGGCAVLAIAMAQAAPDDQPHRAADRDPVPTWSSTRTGLAYDVISRAASTSAPSTSAARSTPASTTAAGASTSQPPQSTSAPSTSARPTTAHPTSASAHATSTSARPSPSTSKPSPKPSSSSPKPKPTKPSGQSLPLPNFYTGSATKVITVVASSMSSTTATLQAWDKAPGWGWFKHGPAVTAHIGSQGMTRSPSEWKSATPVGSFSLTRAFGHYSDPGTALPYVHTTPGDWWISDVNTPSIYNTLQHCSGSCSYSHSPNEHLYYETPYYNYAVVIDYNTRNAGTVHVGAGSAFFLHVSVGSATAGCVAVPQDYLVSIMRWLTPGAHPRILINAP